MQPSPSKHPNIKDDIYSSGTISNVGNCKTRDLLGIAPNLTRSCVICLLQNCITNTLGKYSFIGISEFNALTIFF